MQSGQVRTTTLRITAAGVDAIEALALATHFDSDCACPAIPREGGEITVDAAALASIERCCGSVLDADDVAAQTDDLRSLGVMTPRDAFGMRSAAKAFTGRFRAAVDAVGAHAVRQEAVRLEHAEAERLRALDARQNATRAASEALAEQRRRERLSAAADALRAWRAAIEAVHADPTARRRGQALDLRQEAIAACLVAGHTTAADEIAALSHRAWHICPDELDAVLDADQPEALGI